MFEGAIGIVKSLRLGLVRPYIGAGIELAHVEFESPLDGTSEVITEDGELFGGYGHAGILLQWTPSSYIGVDVRGFEGPTESIADIDYDTDYSQVTLVFGASF